MNVKTISIPIKQKRRLMLNILVLGTLLLLVLVLVSRNAVASSTDTQVQTPEQANPSASTDVVQAEAGNCRVGASVGGTSLPAWIPELGMGWYLNFGYAGTAAPGAEFISVIRVHEKQDSNDNYLGTYTTSPSVATLQTFVDTHRGRLWLIGNEVDRIDVQDDIHADVYARAYHDLYELIKTTDPTAQVANSALVEVTPGRLQYLDMVWDSYIDQFGETMPVDVWNAHIYILAERDADSGNPSGIASIALGTDLDLGIWSPSPASDCSNANDNVYCVSEHDNIDIFTRQVIAMRQWMKDKGQQNKPLIISEYGILWPLESGGFPFEDEFGNDFGTQRVGEFIENTFSLFENTTDPNLGYPADGNHLVQQWLWYSMLGGGDLGNSSFLLKDDAHAVGDLNALTPVGAIFRDRVMSMPRNVNLMAEKASTAHGVTDTGTGMASAELVTTIRNNGSLPTGAPVTVTFYKDSGLTQEIGSTQLAAGVGGCARTPYQATVTWDDIGAPGLHNYWVKVDAANGQAETSETDNVAKGAVYVDSPLTYMSVIARP